MLKIIPLPAFNDNYIWLLQSGAHAVVVDPGDANVVAAYCQRQQLQLSAILITHCHGDHIGGVEELQQRYGCPVYAPAHPVLKSTTRPVSDNDRIAITQPEISFKVLSLPGHTAEHMGYYAAGMLFCGDTLFACGCGRIFDGTARQLHQSLQKLAHLPPDTRIYCSHEYTLANQRFALTVEPDNLALQQRHRRDQALRDANQPTLPSTLADELASNPFLRCDNARIQQAVQRYCGHTLTDSEQVFAELRCWKDTFR